MRRVVSNREAEARITAEEPFRNDRGSFSGIRLAKPVSRYPAGITYGELPEAYNASVRRARYVVFSYETPIGWVLYDGEKVVPDIGYSLTTGQHQFIVRHAWGLPPHPERGRDLRPAGGGPRSGGMDDDR